MLDLLTDIDVVLDVFEGGILWQAFQDGSTSSLAAFIGEAYLKPSPRAYERLAPLQSGY